VAVQTGIGTSPAVSFAVRNGKAQYHVRVFESTVTDTIFSSENMCMVFPFNGALRNKNIP